MEYLNEVHQKKFYALLGEDHTDECDTERQSLFYLLSGNADLYQKRTSFYNSQEHRIILYQEKKERVVLSSGGRALITLGFHLYNGANPEESNVCDIFRNLDEQNRFLALNAIRMRFM